MTRRGAILLEMLVALAMFVGAGMLTLSVVSNSAAGLANAHRRLLAMDLARSKMAELEAGLINVGDLATDMIDAIGSIDLTGLDGIGPTDPSWTWRCEADTTRTEFPGLTLVEVRVYDGPDAEHPAATVRRLVRLRELSVDEYEEDELLQGLPTEGER